MNAISQRPVLITGGAGFIGTNLADRLAGAGHRVIIFDNLNRPGVETNLEWLCSRHPEHITARKADIRHSQAVMQAVSEAAMVYHLAAQVAVTTSIERPVEDFQVNTVGTLNLLEAVRAQAIPPPLVFTSTNKVYGNLASLELLEGERRYQPADPAVRQSGISERQPLAFHSPYGCSKGAAEQYVLDYARIYRLPTLVMRMSCIYGPHQCGTEDQGWVAHFIRRHLRGEPITLYGNGKQVRDLLFVDDLVEALLLAAGHINRLAGQAFNIGGGPDNALSLLDALGIIGNLTGRGPDVRFGPERPGDQAYYVSDTSRFKCQTGWRPKVEARDGMAVLYGWLDQAARRTVAGQDTSQVAMV